MKKDTSSWPHPHSQLFSSTVILSLYLASESPRQLIKTQALGPQPQSFRFGRSGLGLRTYISNKFLGDIDVTGPGNIF